MIALFVYVTYGSGSILLWQRCDTPSTSGFVDDAMFVRISDAKKARAQVTQRPETERIRHRRGLHSN